MGKIRLIGVLLVGLLFSLGACAGPATSSEGVSPAPQVQGVVPAAPAPVQSPAASPAPAAPAPVIAASPVPAPAGTGDFALSNLQITPGTAKPGSDVTVTVKVTNPGGQAATNKVTLNLVMDGEACPTFLPPVKDVTLAAGASQEVTFKINMAADSAGSYTVTVGQLTGSLIVQ